MAVDKTPPLLVNWDQAEWARRAGDVAPVRGSGEGG